MSPEPFWDPRPDGSLVLEAASGDPTPGCVTRDGTGWATWVRLPTGAYARLGGRDDRLAAATSLCAHHRIEMPPLPEEP